MLDSKKIPFSKIVKSQLPAYVREEFPLIGEFLSQYYFGQEVQGGVLDLIENIDQYLKLSENGLNVQHSVLDKDIDEVGTDIFLYARGGIDWDQRPDVDYSFGNIGFPDTWGLVRIDDEIIAYENKTGFNQLNNCKRGFSGITSYENIEDPENLVFSSTIATSHKKGAKVENLSVLFLEEFLKKIRVQLAPRLEGVNFDDKLRVQFLRQTKDLYASRGTDESFSILFKALYNEEVNIIRPKEFLISPSNANWKRTRDLIVEPLLGDPEELLNKTLFQDSYENISEAYAPVSNIEKINVGILTNTFYRISIDGSYTQNFEGSSEALYGKFTPHARTKVIGNVSGQTQGKVSVGQTIVDVDSTVGFPTSGTFEVIYKDGSVGVCSYRNKNLTQFTEVAFVKNPLIFDPRPTRGVEKDISDGAYLQQNTYAYSSGIGSDTAIRVKIRSVLNELEIPEYTARQTVGAKAKIKSLGKIGTNFKQNNWFFNTAQSYDVKTITLVDNINKTYRVTTKDSAILRTGDYVKLTDIDNVQLDGRFLVTDVFNNTSFLIRGQGLTDLSIIGKVTREISKVDSDLHSNLNNYTANVQNTYIDGNDVLIASNSLPSVSLFGTNLKLNPKTQKVVFSGVVVKGQEELQITSGIDHNFFTGDAVYYTPEKRIDISPRATGKDPYTLDLQYELFQRVQVVSSLFSTFDSGRGIIEGLSNGGEGIYFIKRVDANSIKLAKSRSNLYNNIFEKVLIATDDATLGNQTLEKFELHGKFIRNQNLLRKLQNPVNDGLHHETPTGFNGMFINGVEVKNYKSRDVVYYGQVNSIEVVSGGSDYDIINPPELVINDGVGAGATGYCAVRGEFKEIRVVDTGFDYIDQPIIKITGGNGVGAVAKAKLLTIPHELSVNTTGITSIIPDFAGLGTESSIGFTTYHKFRDAEKIRYDTFGRKALVGLDTGNSYYARVINPHTIKLHKSTGDALAGINTVSFTDYGSGTHSFESISGKLILNSIVITNPGSGYENKQRTCDSVGVNTALNIINIKDHDYKSGEIVQYSPDLGSSSVAIVGLSTSTDYYVTVVDSHNFKLSAVGLGTTTKTFNFDQKIYENLTSTGIGTHSFNYKPITVEVIGNVGVSSLGGKDFHAIVQPIVRGQITSIHLTENGVGYGSSEILNFERPCDINVNTGRNAEANAVIHKGELVDVFVGAAGTDFNSPPAISVTGIGTGAELTPILENGRLSSVKVNSKGIGYGVSTTTLRVTASGIGAKFQPVMQTWRVNDFKKNEKNITEDDIFIDTSLNQNKELQCSYVYAPRSLRQVVYATDSEGNTVYGKSDLVYLNGAETDTQYHSPIIGWAYDGNPIYGPYGYSEKSGGVVTQLKSGYKIELKKNRPSTGIFPPEYFVEDFVWNNSTDDAVLDVHNGRFCITPEFPNGTYAYFATIDSTPTSDGVFKSFKRPKFPYLIGDSFKSKPIAFNYKTTSDQNYVDLNKTNWIRNTYPYALDKKNSGYDYVLQSNSYVEQDSIIKSVQRGSVDAVGILTGGSNYKVNDNIVFQDENPNSYPARAKVTRVLGAGVSSIYTETTELVDVDFYPMKGDGRFLGIHTGPHGFDNGTTVIISGLTTTNTLLNGSYTIGVSTSILTLSQGIGTAQKHNAGIVTYIPVTGNLRSPLVMVNDILQIGAGQTQEQVKVLGIDVSGSRLKVLRAYNATLSTPVGVGSIGAGHTATTRIENLERRFTVNAGFKGRSSSRLEREIYFNPKESLGVGTDRVTDSDGSVGIGTTVTIGESEQFVPIQTIYLPNHKLFTGDEITYHTNSGQSIGIASNTNMAGTIGAIDDPLTRHKPLYVARIGPDLIGISTVRVGLSSVGITSLGDYVGIAETNKNTGLLYFVGFGTGTHHSFRLHNNPDVIQGKVSKNKVTVSTATTHGLYNYDTVYVDVNPGVTTTINVTYNKHNRKLLTNGLSFGGSGITTSTSPTGIPDSINIPDHKLNTGQKVVYNSSNPVVGLVDENQYYVYVIDKNSIKLATTKYQTTKGIPTFVGLSSSNDGGTIYPINPPLTVYKQSSIVFDLSDSSLGYTQNTTDYPAFKFELYRDSNYVEIYETNNTNEEFEVKQTGIIGVTANAKVTVTVNDSTPHLLYYRLVPLNLKENPTVNKEIVVDDEIDNNNQIVFENSRYSGKFKVISTGATTFSYDLGRIPEESTYTASEDGAKISYETISPFAYGSISRVKLTDGGKGYTKLPGITTVTSDVGSGAVLTPTTKTIGKAVKTKIENIGFDYPADLTLRPEVRFPQILKIEPLTGFKSIGVTSFGRGYNQSPSLVVLDGRTKKQVQDIDLRFYTNKRKVDILKNTNDLSNTTPIIIPVGNPNGIRVSNIVFNGDTNDVSVTLKDAYSTLATFPFRLGDNVLVENASVGIGSTAKGFNSKEYGYTRFKLTGIATNLGGIGTVTYNLGGHLGVGETPGRFDSTTSDALLVPEGLFPQFDVKLQANRFRSADTVTDGFSEGTVGDWLPDVKLLTVESSGDFEVGKILVSPDTGDKGLISDRESFGSSYKLDYYSIVENGWEYLTGVLNNEHQRIHDNDYYQNFSYSIKSKVPVQEWDNIVSSLNHTSGFKQFSELQIESTLGQPISLGSTSKITNKLDLIGLENINCEYNFDLVTENWLQGSDIPFSNEIIFNTQTLTDYSQSVSNRVLTIDDFSNEFNSNPRSTRYADVHRHRALDGRLQKFLTYVRDRSFTGERQLMWVTVYNDSGRGLSMLNQYGRVETTIDLGSFDYALDGSDGVLRFYPTKYEFNNYNVVTWAYNIDGIGIGTNTLAAIGSTTIGVSTGSYTESLVSVASSNVLIAGGSSGTIVSIAGIGATDRNNCRSAKVLVSVETSEGDAEFDELNIIHDGTEAYYDTYGQLTIHSADAYSSVGDLGTYRPYLDSNNVLKLDYYPAAGITTARVSTLTVGISSESAVGVGTYDMSFGSILVEQKRIDATGVPEQVGVATFTDHYDAAYCVVQISDLTNEAYELKEVLVIDDWDGSLPEEVYYTEYGNVVTGNAPVTGLGTIGARRTGVGQSLTEITFTPNSGIDIEVKTFMNAMRIDENTSLIPGGRALGGEATLDLEQASITSMEGFYEGTENAVKKAFDLTHKEDPIFKREFDGSSSSIVEVDGLNSTFSIPNHFFVTGQELEYKPLTGVGTNSIGIGTTNVSGIGNTNVLPPTVFAIKISEDKLKLAKSAENALKRIAVPFDITSVGITTQHYLTAKTPNTKVIVAIDNQIQSPIADTSITTTLAKDLLVTEDVVRFSGITSFYGADYVKIDSEIMKILSVGIGSTNTLKVRRNWLGTTLAEHTVGATVTKIRGNYNIVENTINFIEAPYGKTPLSTSTADPEYRDWTGITTSSSFQGRVFTRSGVVNGTTETYTENYLYDDISQQFTGKDKTFELKASGSNVSGMNTINGVFMINGIFQQPGANANYEIVEESAGISSIRFTGAASSTAADINTANVPVGGVIVSVASSHGFNYQPLVSAGGTAVVSLAGTITSVSIGNSGSGYRSGIQTVAVGIQTESVGAAGITSIGLATVVSGFVTSITINNPQVFYRPRDIRNVGYSSITGLTTVTTATSHGLKLGEEVVLSGIGFTCNYAPAVGIQSAVYTNTTGIMTVTTLSAHGLATSGKSSQVVLTGLAMTCGLGATVNHIYPRNRDYAYDTSIGIASDGKAYTVTDADYTPTTGITTITIAGHGFSNGDKIKLADNSLTFTCAKDQHTTDHSYPRSSDPVHGQWLGITSVTTDTFVVNVLGITTLPTSASTNTGVHTFKAATTNGLTYNDGTITVNVTAAKGPSARYDHTFIEAATDALITGGNYTHTFDSATTNGVTVTSVGTFTPTDATYNPSTGDLVLTIAGHSYTTSNTVSFATSSITFTCEMDGNTSAKSYPRATDPVAGIATAITSKTTDTITVNIGASPFVKFTPNGATYDQNTGDMTLSIGSHSLTAGTSVKINEEGLTFTCTKDGNATEHKYPRASDPFYDTAIPITGVAGTTITLNVGAAYAGDQYTHRFVGAATSAIIAGGTYSHAFRYATENAVTSVGNTQFTPTTASYTASTGDLVLTIPSHGLNAPTTHTVSNATYDPVVGIVTMTVAGHNFVDGDFIKLADDSLTFSCTHGSGNKTYPRSSDPISDKWVAISNVTTNTFAIQVLDSVPSTNTTAHTFVSATSSGLTRARNLVGISTGSIVFACEMDDYGSDHAYPRASDPIAGINTVITAATTDTLTVNVGTTPVAHFNVSAAQYDERLGHLKLTIGSHTLTTENSIKIAKESLRFTCSKDNYATQHRYPRAGDPNYAGAAVVGVASDTQFTVNVGISTVPTQYVSGGTAQPTIIAPRASNNSISKQDVAYDGTTVTRILDDNRFEVNTGISTRNHRYSRGGRVDKLMKVVIDDPVSYEDLMLEYSGTSPSQGGNQARASVVVGQGSSVIDFELTNTGYGYGVGHVLTVPTGGTTGIPTFSNYNINNDEFTLTVDTIDNDVFTAWSLGQLEVLDDFSHLFDGVRKTFPISKDGDSLSIQAKPGSIVSVRDCLLIFINDILQVPGEAYFFEGGSKITFEEAPKGSASDGSYAGDTLKFLFYKGTGGVDVIDVDIIDTVKQGDNLTIKSDRRLKQNPYNIDQDKFLNQDHRTVTEVVSSSTVDTHPYYGPGLTDNSRMLRPVVWCRQTEDKFISGKRVAKDRELYEPIIKPTAYLTQPVGVGSTVAYVDNVRPFFNPKNENEVSVDFQKEITFKSQIARSGAAATAVIDDDWSQVSSVVISDGGSGYLTAPEVTIQNPVGLGSTLRASATASITAGVVTSITVSYGGTAAYNDHSAGTGYTSANPPLVLISPPTTPTVIENDTVSSYYGDQGVIVGFGTTAAAAGTNQAVFQFFVPLDSPLRDGDITNPGLGNSALSGIQTGDYFVVKNSCVGIGSTTFATTRQDGTQIGVTTHFILNGDYVGNNIDCVYQVADYHDTKRYVTGHGYSSGISTYVREVYANVSGIGTIKFDVSTITFDSSSYKFDNSGGGINFTGGISTNYSAFSPPTGRIGPDYFFGEFSWGKIVLVDRASATNSFNSYNDKGSVGITTGDHVIRQKKMKFKNYST